MKRVTANNASFQGAAIA